MLVLMVGIGSFVAGWIITALMRRYALANSVLDVPNDRSSHEIPTPRGGGVGIVLPVMVALLAAPALLLGSGAGLVAAAAVLIVAAIGWLDDHRSLGVKSRLVGHVAAGALVAFFAIGVPEYPFGVAAPLALAGLWWVFWTVSLINVVNFIDGIDGIIGLQALLFGLYAIAATGIKVSSAAIVGAALAGASIGFLLLNWSPARIFMGDVGSGSLGVVFVLLGVLTIIEVEWTVVHAFLPLMPIFADEVMTMARRISRGESLSEPHRTHVYQRLVQAGLGHGSVAALYGVLALACGAWGLMVRKNELVFWFGAVVTLLVVFVLLAGLRGWAERRAAAESRLSESRVAG